jgi:hypothetical protein
MMSLDNVCSLCRHVGDTVGVGVDDPADDNGLVFPFGYSVELGGGKALLKELTHVSIASRCWFQGVLHLCLTPNT